MWPPLVLPELDSSRPNAARVYDCLLGGKDHYAVDAEAAAVMEKAAPGTRAAALANRQFLIRALTWAAERGHSQFLELGTGIPTHLNVHEVAQAARPSARVVYVDHDDVVVTHARALLARLQTHVGVVQGDLRDLQPVLEDAARWLDFGQPVVASVVGVLHWVSEEDNPAGVVAGLARNLAPGSVLIMSHACSDRMEAAAVAMLGRTLARELHRLTIGNVALVRQLVAKE
ncbi:SAM-dependent methyltransferase, partial [Nonomuraea sp. NPDC004702]